MLFYFVIDQTQGGCPVRTLQWFMKWWNQANQAQVGEKMVQTRAMRNENFKWKPKTPKEFWQNTKRILKTMTRGSWTDSMRAKFENENECTPFIPQYCSWFFVHPAASKLPKASLCRWVNKKRGLLISSQCMTTLWAPEACQFCGSWTCCSG